MTEASPPEQITLIDETGTERRFSLHDAFEMEGVPYYLVEDATDPERVLLLRETDGALETVEGDEFNRAMQALEEDRVD